MDWFKIGKGVHQDCILSPCLFNFYAEYIMRNAGLEETQAGWQYTILTYFFSYLEPVCSSMPSSNCCFLTCIQISQELHRYYKMSVAHCPPQVCDFHSSCSFTGASGLVLEPGDANETSSLPLMRLICWLGELTLSNFYPNVWAGTGASKYLPCLMTLDLWFLRTVLG